MRTHRRPSALLAIALATAAVVIAAQPFASPWWRYADADSIYVGSALDIVHGDRTHYFDHPGLPLQEALAIVFTGTALVSGESPSQYARNGLTNFDRTRVVYRTFAALAFLALVAFAFRVGRRAFGGEQWGLAAALLVLAAPALAPLSIQVRPDVLLSLLVLAAAWQISEAWRTRIAAHFAGAALLIGCGTMLKAHAAGMLVPLVVTAIVRHPTEAWWSELRTRVGAWIRRRRTAAIGAALVWLALAVYLNVLAWPFGPAPSQRRLILEVIGIFVGFTAAAWAGRRLRFRAAERVFDPFYGFVAALVVAGVALPVSLFVGDGLTGIESVLRTLGGHGINENVVRFRWFRTLEQTYQTLSSAQIAPALPVFAAAILAGLVALRQRDSWPVPWLIGAVALSVMAAARSTNFYYFAPGYVLAIPPALWALRTSLGARIPIVAWVAIALIAASPLFHRPGGEREGGKCQAAVAQAVATLRPNEVVLLPAETPSRDLRYWVITTTTAAWLPPHAYRTFLDDPAAARSLGLIPRTRITADCRALPIA